MTYDGEDRDWLLGLTREATASIDGISLASVDHELWSSEFGRRYLDAQRHAVRAGQLDILEQHPEMQTNPQTVLVELGREMGQGHAAG